MRKYVIKLTYEILISITCEFIIYAQKPASSYKEGKRIDDKNSWISRNR